VNPAVLRPKVIVIEDNPTDVFLIREAIKEYGVDADLEVFQDGEEALNLLTRMGADDDVPCPALVLLDINLPKTDGLKVLEQMRQSRGCKNTLVVVMTSSAAQSDRAKATELNADVYFLKPSGYDAFLKLGGIMQDLLKQTSAS
jgi:two-component system, chemotaxis family, response regulator Rcp1